MAIAGVIRFSYLSILPILSNSKRDNGLAAFMNRPLAITLCIVLFNLSSEAGAVKGLGYCSLILLKKYD